MAKSKRTGKKSSSRKGRKRGRSRKKGLKSKPFPDQVLVKLKSQHQVEIDPGISGAVAYFTVATNNPLNPLVGGVSWSLIGSERHPKYWDIYEQMYENFEVISAKVSCQFINSTATLGYYTFVVPVATDQFTEMESIITDTFNAGIRLREANRRAVVQMHATSVETANHNKLFVKINNRKLESTSDTDLMQGKTSATNTEAAPTRTPRVYCGLGSLRSVDLGVCVCIVTIDYIIKFSKATAHQEGATIA